MMDSRTKYEKGGEETVLATHPSAFTPRNLCGSLPIHSTWSPGGQFRWLMIWKMCKVRICRSCLPGSRLWSSISSLIRLPWSLKTSIALQCEIKQRNVKWQVWPAGISVNFHLFQTTFSNPPVCSRPVIKLMPHTKNEPGDRKNTATIGKDPHYEYHFTFYIL